MFVYESFNLLEQSFFYIVPSFHHTFLMNTWVTARDFTPEKNDVSRCFNKECHNAEDYVKIQNVERYFAIK